MEQKDKPSIITAVCYKIMSVNIEVIIVVLH
jgi:hypothetical protein